MTSRIPREWLVYDSLENEQHDRCVDLFERPDKTYGFEEFRRDAEDAGAWTQIHYYGDAVYPSREAAFGAALKAVGWLGASRPRAFGRTAKGGART